MKEYKIIILDFSDASVHVYDYDLTFHKDEDEWFENSEHNQKNCEWMIVNKLNIQIH